ncbi:MAG: cation:proton antiporter subunit C [Minwuia sp.]|uniref:cation:proton antiporter subunit C n=1 Tax=Minwuia sp. TaxID=2493630 RepID=UPI003A8833A2
MSLLGQYNYWIFAIVMSLGLYITISRGNLVKKVVGLNIFQASVFLLYISSSKIWDATAPIFVEGEDLTFSNPLPHVLILTAIVVGVATTAIGLALVVRIKEAYGSVEEDEVLEAQAAFEAELKERAGG